VEARCSDRSPAGEVTPVPVVVRQPAIDEAGLLDALAGILVDCVRDGASVNFVLPFDLDRGRAFWLRNFEQVAAGERVLLVAEDPEGAIVGTVQVVLSTPENQPHRGEIAKLLVSPRARRCGAGEALMAAAEAAALAAGRTLLVLDTASDSAERLYERRGWTRLGVIPGYALWPAGGLGDAVFFYKHLT
jgi:ribosomal protein S18 acetylase RimI-like enzyme